MRCDFCDGLISRTSPTTAKLFGKVFCDKTCRNDFVDDNTKYGPLG